MTVKLGTHTTYDKRTNPIDFQGHGSHAMAVGTGGGGQGGGGLALLLFRDVKKKSIVKMHLNDANWM